MIAPLAAAKAYATVQAQTATLSKAAGDIAGGQQTQGPGFGELLQNAMTDAVKQSRYAETQMSAQVQGKASLVDVVTALSSAETSLQTVMAVRDQVIGAYQQVMQMQI